MGMWDMLAQNQNDNFLRNKAEADNQAALEKQLLLETIMSKKDFNQDAQVGFWDKLKPWDTANERADALNRQAMALQPGGSEALANSYYDAEGQTSGAKWMDKNWNYTPTTEGQREQSLNNASQSLKNIGQGMQDLKSKYFGGSAVAQPVQKVIQPETDLPSSLAPQDNISSFWDYLKNKQ